MRRLLLITISIIAILFTAGIVCYIKMEYILSCILSSELKTTVSIADISFSHRKNIDIQMLTIANPQAFPSPYALEVESVHLSAPYTNYLNKLIDIPEIILTNMTLTIDFIDGSSNWDTLMHNLETDLPVKESSHTSALINTLTFKNLHISLAKSNGEFETHKIPKLTLRNVQTKEGDLTRRIAQAILTQAIYNIQNIIKLPLNIPQETLDTLWQKLLP